MTKTQFLRSRLVNQARAEPSSWLVIAIAASLCAAGQAQDQPPAASTPIKAGPVWLRQFPEPPKFDVDVKTEGRGVSVESPALGTLIESSREPLYAEEGPLTVKAEVRPAAGGFDVAYVITNPTESPQRLPRLQIDGHRLEPRVQWLSARVGTTFTDLQWSKGTTLVAPDVPYPRTLYAPVMVARDSRVALGIALQYPILEYAHPVRVFMMRPATADHWMSLVRLDGQIPSGQSRTYTVSVRYALPDDWIHTLAPYKAYLHSLYGAAPKYHQDMRPVFGRFLAYNARCSKENPRGFDPQTRPDINGWGKEVDGILGHATRNGFDRVMVWLATGAYSEHPKNNFPAGMMRFWTPTMDSTAEQWRRIADSGIELGFWWGRSTEVADKFDDDEFEAFGPNNPRHLMAMLREYRLAAKRGATCIGMDSFRVFPPWQAVPWLARLREENDTMRFVGEPQSNDVMHFQIPQCTTEDQVPTPPLLSDYLVPGRETWVLLRGKEANMDRAGQVIGWGMTVLTFEKTIAARDLATAVRVAQRRGAQDDAVSPLP